MHDFVSPPHDRFGVSNLAEAVEWPDSGLECGEPGFVYLPIITPGFRAVLEADRQAYIYHTNTSDQFILCNQPRPIKTDPTP